MIRVLIIKKNLDEELTNFYMRINKYLKGIKSNKFKVIDVTTYHNKSYISEFATITYNDNAVVK